MKRQHMLYPAIAALLAGLAAGCGGSPKSTKQTRPPSKTLSSVQIANKLKPSTVEVYGREGSGWFGGTGVLIDKKNGLVLTNAHVISGLATITVRYKSDEESATVVGQAPCEDVAVVKMASVPAGMREVEWAKTARNVKSGQPVTALGYPESFQSGYEQRVTVTNGTVSVDGPIGADPAPDLPHYASVIQHGATVNHGNSGGPLVNSRGQLLGINTLGNTRGGVVQSQFYAITIDHIRSLLSRLEAGKDIGYVGWDVVPYAEWKSYYGERKIGHQYGWSYHPRHNVGMLVLGVDPGSPAEQHHFTAGDWFTSLNGVTVNNVQQLCDVINSNEGHTMNVDGTTLTNGKDYTEPITLPKPVVGTSR